MEVGLTVFDNSWLKWRLSFLAIIYYGDWDYHFTLAIMCDRVWDVPFYEAICDMSFGTCRMAHRVEGLFIVAGGFTHVHEDRILYCVARLGCFGVDGCFPCVGQSETLMRYDPGM